MTTENEMAACLNCNLPECLEVLHERINDPTGCALRAMPGMTMGKARLSGALHIKQDAVPSGKGNGTHWEAMEFYL